MDEWALLKELRIRAVADAPDAFAQTSYEVQSEPQAYWQQLAENLGLPHHEFFIAFVNEEPVGMAYGCLEADDRHVAHVGSMWVAPTTRGKGIGKRLLETVVSWAAKQGATRLKLWVTAGNTPATQLYEASGFVPTGATDMLRPDSGLQIIEMERNLGLN